MIKDDVFLTRTMAKVFADQGNLEKAEEIYRYLLEREPGRKDLLDALAAIERKRFAKDPAGLDELFETWMDLLSAWDRLRKLKRLKRKTHER